MSELCEEVGRKKISVKISTNENNKLEEGYK
jgi:hypothetical protein